MRGYGNYDFVIDSSFRPYSFKEMLAPLAMYKEEYENTEAAYQDLTDKASIWEGMANEERDPIAYAQYKRYADDLRSRADDLVQHGLNPGNRRELMNLRRRYASEITPIEQAYANRKAQADEQRKALLQNPTLLLSRRADMTSLDDYLRNPQLGYDQYSGALLTKQVGDAASHLAKELREYSNGKSLDGFTRTWLQQHGYTATEVAQAINNPDSPHSNKILTSLVDNVMADSGVSQWADKATLNQAYSYARQGLWNAVGENKVQTYIDEAAKLAAQEESQKRIANYTKSLADADGTNAHVSRLAINPVNIYSKKEMEESGHNMSQYAKYFTTDANGVTRMTAEGLREYRRKVPKYSMNPTGAAIVTGQQDSPFKVFVDSIGGKEAAAKGQVGNVGNLWMQYNASHKGSGYDATKSTEFIYDIDPSQQDNMKRAVMRAGRGTELQEVDFDRKTNTFKSTGDTMSMEDLNNSKVSIISTTFSPYGSTVLVQDADGNVRRFNLPKGINPTNEANRNNAMKNVQIIQNALSEYSEKGYYTDKRGNRITPTPEQVAGLREKYAQELQKAYLYHSQLGMTNKTKEQEFNPYGY